MRLVKLCTAAVLAVGVSAAAQPPGGGRGQGGGGMFGGGPTGPDRLLASKTVQGELKLADDQATKLTTWAKGFADKAQAIRREKLEGVDRSEMVQKMPEVTAAVSKAAYAELADVLKPAQVARLKQIEVQMAGAQAFAMPDVQAALKLTDDQADKLKDAQRAMQTEMRELGQELFGQGGGGGRPDPAKMQEFQKKTATLTADFMTKAEGLLTADQKAAWKQVTGDKVDVQKVREEMPRPMGRPKKDD